MDDSISRQAVLKLLHALPPEEAMTKALLIQGVKQMDAAQAESLIDKEQRIFLAAMAREEKVCKQVDDECRDCREPYEDSLVRICHEITRKVKGALWT